MTATTNASGRPRRRAGHSRRPGHQPPTATAPGRPTSAHRVGSPCGDGVRSLGDAASRCGRSLVAAQVAAALAAWPSPPPRCCWPRVLLPAAWVRVRGRWLFEWLGTAAWRT